MVTSKAGWAEDFSDFSYSRTRPEAEAERDEARRGMAVRVVASQALDVADARHLLSVLGLSDLSYLSGLVLDRRTGSPTTPALVTADVS